VHAGKNSAYLADIEAVFETQIIDPKSARFLFLVRFLETLNRPSRDSFKMERACFQIGKLMGQGTQVILVGARPEDNPNVTFKNTQPTPLFQITTPMQAGAKRAVYAGKMGKFRLFQHMYAAHWLSCSRGEGV
jgi:hypothetical protein